jgi:uncharacterized membrane protein
MSFDVSSEITIERPPGVVAAYVCDPENATIWHGNIRGAEWKSEPLVRVGSRVAFVAEFLGKRLDYTYELVEFEPGEKLVMRSVEGPFPMETSYTFEETRDGYTKVTLRNHGEPTGVSKVMTPMISTAMRAANDKDLAKLKTILEGH